MEPTNTRNKIQEVFDILHLRINELHNRIQFLERENRELKETNQNIREYNDGILADNDLLRADIRRITQERDECRATLKNYNFPQT